MGHENPEDVSLLLGPVRSQISNLYPQEHHLAAQLIEEINNHGKEILKLAKGEVLSILEGAYSGNKLPGKWSIRGAETIQTIQSFTKKVAILIQQEKITGKQEEIKTDEIAANDPRITMAA